MRDEIKLFIKPPIVFPEPRVLSGMAEYKNEIPFTDILSSAKSILGAVYGVDDDGVDWLENLLKKNHTLQCRIILIIYPTCPTRENTLIRLAELQDTMGDRIRLSLYPIPLFGAPANALLFVCEQGKNYLFTGSSPNFGFKNDLHGQVNFLLEADVAIIQKWQTFVNYMWYLSAPLTLETARIPKLVPAEGTWEAAQMWKQYLSIFPGESMFAPGLQVDINEDTGEVTATLEDGTLVSPVTADIDLPPYSALVVDLGSLYNQGSQVIVDKLSRIGPLDAPVKPDYFGMIGEYHHGRVTRRTQYRISAISQNDLKTIERHRKTMQVALESMSYSLGDGVHWMPDAVRPLYQKEINYIKSEAEASLKAIVNGDAETFVNKNRDRLCSDLDNMYQEVKGGGNMSRVDVEAILKDLVERLKRALEGKILPDVSYNSILFRDGNDVDPGSWGQAVTLLRSIALYSRKSITSDRYFAMGLMVDRDELREAMNVLDDVIYKERGFVYDRAKNEIEIVKEIVESSTSNKEKCQALMNLIQGKGME